ncbi:hypothetical protein FRB97_003591 [Tulasnella sp. 331]|nr:hypothetical protein FRB97_003591 [Tulasnella sp. 331]
MVRLWTEWLEVNDDGWVTDHSIQMVQRIAPGELNHDPNPSDNEYDPGDEEQNDEEEDSSFFGDTEECMDVLTMSGLSSADKDLITPWMPVSSKLFYFATDSSSDDCTESEFNADDEFGAV